MRPIDQRNGRLHTLVPEAPAWLKMPGMQIAVASLHDLHFDSFTSLYYNINLIQILVCREIL
jgi:hypothetical protein